MSEANWRRLKQSEVMDCGAELPARVLLEHAEADHSYRTFVETFTGDGKLGFKAARYFN